MVVVAVVVVATTIRLRLRLQAIYSSRLSKMANIHRGYAKAYLREPIDPLELSHMVKKLPMVKTQRVHPKKKHRCYYSTDYFFVVVMCNKVTKSGLNAPGIECLMEWGISDYHDRKVRLADTRYLYIEAQYDWHEEFTESWQKEVNQLMIAIKGLIEPLIMDPPPQIVLDQRENVAKKRIQKVTLAAALQRAVAERVRMDAPKSTDLSFLKGGNGVTKVRGDGVTKVDLEEDSPIDLPPNSPGASAPGTQDSPGASAPSTQSAASTGASAPGTRSTQEVSLQVSLQDIGLGFIKDEQGHVVLHSNFSAPQSWMWLMEHRQRILDAEGLPDDAILRHHMPTALKNIEKYFVELIKMVPKNTDLEVHDPNVPWTEKRWILLHAPWQPKVPHEDEIPQPRKKPPSKLVSCFSKSVLTKWFGKDTLATPYKQ